MKIGFNKNHDLVTNFDKEEEPLYRKAIEQYGWNGLYITEDAYWRDGTKDNRLSALICKEERDLSKFWDIFYGLKNTGCIDKEV